MEKLAEEDYGVDTLKITDDDAAFILGKGGKTKEKIAKVAEAEIELFERDLILEIRGSKIQRKRAKKYCEGVMAQRTGPVSVTDDYDDDDLTLLQVPQEAVGFDQWTTLMFFCEVDKGRGRDKAFEKLAIFGTIRARRGAELLVLSAVETKDNVAVVLSSTLPPLLLCQMFLLFARWTLSDSVATTLF
eukprot:s640_g5.t1